MHTIHTTHRETPRRVYALGVFLILLTCYGYFFPKWSDWGANSRLDLVFAVVEKGTFRIDDFHANTNDKADYNGHYYSDKSFGPSLIALPPYLTFRALMRLDAPLRERLHNDAADPAKFFANPDSPREGFIVNDGYTEIVMAVLAFWAGAVPSALLGVLVYWFAARFATRPQVAFYVALVYGLATIAFPYSTVLYQHQLGALGMFGGFALLWIVIVEDAHPRFLYGAGAFLGLALISDYPTAPFLVLIALWALYALRRGGRFWMLWRAAAGGLPFVLLLGAYNWRVFGGPFTLGYTYSVTDVDVEGFFGIVALDPWRLYGVTVSTFRGLFFISPILLVALPGWLFMWQKLRADAARAAVLLLIAIPVGFLLYNASMVTWTAGASIGPRYVAPMLPLLALPLVFSFNQMFRKPLNRRIVWMLVAASAFNVWAQTLGGQYYPFLSGESNAANQNPLIDHALPRLADGDIQRNWGSLIGLPGWLSLVPLILLLALWWWIVLPWLARRSRPALEDAAPSLNT